VLHDASRVYIHRQILIHTPVTLFFSLFFLSSLQCFLYVVVNLPDIKPDTLDYKLEPTKISFKARGGECVTPHLALAYAVSDPSHAI
jgi:hypothetical protein